MNDQELLLKQETLRNTLAKDRVAKALVCTRDMNLHKSMILGNNIFQKFYICYFNY